MGARALLAALLLAALAVGLERGALGLQSSWSFISWPCGQQTMKVDSRIVGGEDAQWGRWPWMGSLLRGTHVCAATLISRRWALSATHCFYPKYMDPSIWKVQFGELARQPPFWNVRAHRNRYRVQAIVTYPAFTDEDFNDVTLLKLASSVSYSKYVQPICLGASSAEFLNRDNCFVTGWGHNVSHTLQEARVSVINESRCVHLLRQPTTPDERSSFCAGVEDGSRDSCTGDSGGPLTCERDGLWIHVGIVSWGWGCGKPNRPGVYTNVSSYFSWIQAVVGRAPRPAPSPLLLLPLALPWAAPGLMRPAGGH